MPGSGYSLAETVPGGWDQTGVTCNDGSPVSNINVSAGEVVTCTFTNRKRGQIVVVHDAVPDDAAGLRVHGRRRPLTRELLARRRPRPDALEHAARSTTSRSGPATRSRRACRPAGISRAPPATTAALCRTSTCRTGETVTCTFTNHKRGQVVVVKDATPDDPQDFSFTAGGGLSPASFQLDDDADATLSNTRTFTDVPAGNGYSLSETVPGGWDQTSATCDDGSPVSNIDVAPGETVTCTFANRKRGQHRGREGRRSPTTRRTSRFTAGGGPVPGQLRARRRRRRHPVEHAARSTNVVPGSGYSISETVPSGWDQPSASCSDGSPPSNIDRRAPARPSPARSPTRSAGDRDRRGLGPERFAGLRLHGRRRALAHESPARRRRRRDAVEHAHVRRRAAGRRVLGLRDRACGWDLRERNLRRRQPGIQHHPVPGRDRDLHVHEPQARPGRGRQGRSARRSAGLLVHGRRRALADELPAR